MKLALASMINLVLFSSEKKIETKINIIHNFIHHFNHSTKSNFKFFRNFMYHLLSPKIIDTNPLCLIRNEVINDRSEPTIEVSLGKHITSFYVISILKNYAVCF